MSTSPRPLAVFTAVLVLLVPVLSAQDSRPTSAALKLKKKGTALQRLLAAGEADRSEALIGFLQDQIATGAVYAGQYSVLRKLDWNVQKLLEEWVAKAPRQVVDKDSLRGACINALRDVVEEGKATDELRKAMKTVAEDWFEAPAVKRTATYALAQFGDRSLVDKSIKAATRKTKSENVGNQAQGWLELATTHYNLRKYDEAIKSYRQLLALEGQIRLVPSVFYNCACSLALAGKKDEALQMVEKALEMNKTMGSGPGSIRKSLLETDMDIQSLRGDERFAALMKKYFGEPQPTSQPTSKPTSQPSDKK